MKLSLILTLVLVSSNKLENVVNKARKALGIKPVIYDNELHTYLEDFRDNLTDLNWFYEDTNETFYSYTTEYGDTRVNRLQGSIFKPLNNTYMFRDTYNSKRSSVVKIFKYRIKQARDCMDIKMCNTTSFNFFRSCVIKPIVYKPALKCSWVFAYYPFMVLPSLKSFACVRNKHIGRYVPEGMTQDKNFFCYGTYEWEPKNDAYFLI